MWGVFKIDSESKSPRRAIVLLGLGVLLIATLLTLRDVQAYRKLTAIQQHGQRTDAIVDAINWSCGRGPGSYSAVYHYAVPLVGKSAPAQFAGEEYLGPCRANDPHYVYANATGRVPIAYDVSNPQNSALNFDDSVFTGAQARGRIADAKGGLLQSLLFFAAFSLVLIAGHMLDRHKFLQVQSA